MIEVNYDGVDIILKIDAVSDKQKEYFTHLIHSIPGYEWDRSLRLYRAPIIELKNIASIIGSSMKVTGDKSIMLAKYKEAVLALKESLDKYEAKKFISTLDTSKEYSFLKLPLKDFQKVAVEWGSARKGLAQIYGGVIADEVGLGKTVESMSIIANLKDKGVCDSGIILCPPNMCSQWASEIDKFTYLTSTVVFSKYSKKKRVELYENFHSTFLIIGYELFIKDFEEIMESSKVNSNLNISFLIVDEAHKMKNTETLLYKKVSKINPAVKLLLTATPIKRDVDDLYALFNYLDPSIFISWNYFKNKFLRIVRKFNRDIPVGSKKEMEPFLHRLISPYMLRRKSTEVSKEIPVLIENFVPIESTKEQDRWFKILSLEIEKSLKEAEKALKDDYVELAKMKENMFMSKFRALSVCSNDMRMLSLSNSKQTQKLIDKNKIKDFKSPKLDWLMDFVDSRVNITSDFFDGVPEKIVIFSQYETMVRLIDESILKNISCKKNSRVKTMLFTGKMPKGCRKLMKDGSPIDCFNCIYSASCESVEKSKFLFVNDASVNVLICSDAAQAGLNLQVARYLVNFDLPYSPGSVEQRNGRIKRIGSVYKNVCVYNLYMTGSLDEGVVSKLQKRRDSIDVIVEDIS